MLIKTDLINKIMSEIAPKYFDADEYSEITKSRTGMFGVISETMGTMFENAVINNAIKERERLTITASRETLVQESASYPELIIPHSTPASIQLYIGIPTNYLRSNFLVNLSTIEFTLASDSIITISDMKFLLDYDVRIMGVLMNGVFSYSAQYIMTGENPLNPGTNPYLITSKRMINGEEYLLVNVTARQLEKTYEYYNIVETDPVYTNGIDFKYTGQLAYFNVFYRDSGQNDFILLDKINYFSKLTREGRYVRYNDANPGVIKLTIPDTFNYTFNSEFRVDIYTTLGSKGNFVYRTGQVSVLPQSYDDVIDYTGSYFYPIVISDSVGGSDEPTTEELRNMIINYKSTLRSVDTEQDLNNFFKEADQVDNMIFIKKRIDIFEKQYTGFMIMRDENLNILPTNTLNMHLTEDDVDEHYIQTQRRVVKPTAAYSLKEGESFEVVKNKTVLTPEVIRNLEEDATKFLFGCPYLIVLNEDPPSTSFYLNSVNNENTLAIEYSKEDAPLQFIINRMNVSRNAIAGEDAYKVSLNLLPAGELPEGIVDDDGNIIDASKIKVFGYVYSTDDDEVIAGYFNLNLVSYNKNDNYFQVEAFLKTDDYITMQDQLRIVDTIHQAGTSNVYDYITNLTDVVFGIAVYYDDGGGFVDKGTYVDVIPDMDNYGLANVYTNRNDRSTLMLDMTRVISSITTFEDEGEGDISFRLKQVPLIRYSDLKNQISRISTSILKTNSTILSMLNLIRNNSSIDYKFYATYGRSKYFTMEDTNVYLDKLNISLNFRVRILSTRIDGSIINDLRAYMKPLIEQVNVLGVNNSIYLSNVITQVENEFKYNQNRILALELTGINNYEELYQAIVNTTKPLELMSKEEMLDYVPEYVKLDLDKINIEIVVV